MRWQKNTHIMEASKVQMLFLYTPPCISVNTQEYIPTVEELQQSVNSFVTFFIYFILFALILLVALVITLIHFTKQWQSKKDSDEYLMHVIQAQEEERSRLSSELHDSLAQDLRVALSLVQEEKPHEIIKDCISSVRSLCYNLAPPDIATEHLSDALKSLCLSLQKETGLDVSFTARQEALALVDSVNLTPLQKITLYRIVQELLVNVKKHARANDVSVIIRREGSGEPAGLYLFVSDDGIGFDVEKKTEADSSGGFGLRGIRQRVMQLGGSISIQSEPDCGTDARLFVPEGKFSGRKNG